MSKISEAMNPSPYHGGVAGHKEGTTSLAAAVAVTLTLADRQAEVMKVLRAHFAATGQGMTPDEVAATLGRDEKAIRPRFTELGKHRGLIEKTGERRKNESGMSANVWRPKL